MESPQSPNYVCLPLKSARGSNARVRLLVRHNWHLGLNPDVEDMTGPGEMVTKRALPLTRGWWYDCESFEAMIWMYSTTCNSVDSEKQSSSTVRIKNLNFNVATVALGSDEQSGEADGTTSLSSVWLSIATVKSENSCCSGYFYKGLYVQNLHTYCDEVLSWAES